MSRGIQRDNILDIITIELKKTLCCLTSTSEKKVHGGFFVTSITFTFVRGARQTDA